MSDQEKQYGTIEALLAKKIRRYAEETFGGILWRFQSLSELEKSDYDAFPLDKSGQVDFKKVKQHRRRLLILSLVDGNGTRIATEAHLAALEQVDGKITSDMYDFAAKHCGVSKGKGEEQEKNSDATPGDASQSA